MGEVVSCVRSLLTHNHATASTLRDKQLIAAVAIALPFRSGA